MSRILRLFLFVVFATASFSLAADQHLTQSEITKIMSQIFEEHVDQHDMTVTVLRNAFKIYIDQFDSDRLYLVQSEVEPYLHPSEVDMQKYLDQYRHNNFSAFSKLNGVIQKAIFRARSARHLSESARDAVFTEAARMDPVKGERIHPDSGLAPFVKAEDELTDRWHTNLIDYITFEMTRFGTASVIKKQKYIVDGFEDSARTHEDNYLFVDDKGHALSREGQEHLFTLHVLKALANSVDAHTSFFNDEEAFDMKMRLEKGFQGVGIVFTRGLDGFIVNDLIPKSPAERSGKIKVDDQVIAINGEKLQDKALEQVVDLVRANKDGMVTLLLQRPNEQSRSFEVKLKPEEIVVDRDRVETSIEKVDGGIIGRITLHAFYEGSNGISSVKDVENAIKELQKEGNLIGLVLDLRDNSGGYLTQAVKVAGLFISNGVIVVSKYNDGAKHYYRDLDSKAYYKGPLVILTSRFTASAAEIVAQALQDYGVGLVVGDDHTYGKGTIQAQTVTDGSSTSYFKVTVGKYYTVSGKSPQIFGVHADIVVPGPYSRLEVGEEYLDRPEPNDSIAPDFNDNLADVEPAAKEWYLHYYMPSLQPRVTLWKDALSALRQRSAVRTNANQDYQVFLNELDRRGQRMDPALENGKAKDKSVDYQLDEAMAIAKDMVYLNSQVAQKAPSERPEVIKKFMSERP